MKLKAFAVSAVTFALPVTASAASTVQSEVPLSAGVLLAVTALVAVAAFLMRKA